MDGLVLPDYNNSICNLFNEELSVFGIENPGKRPGLDLKRGKKTTLLFLDGFGWNLYSNTRYFSSFKKVKVSSVFPSSTDTASISLISGLNPGMHGIIGYKAFLKLAGAIIKPLENTYASAPHSNNLLGHIGKLRDVVRIKTIFNVLSKKRIRSLVITPSFIVNSSFSSLIFSGATEISGYENIWDAFYIYRKALENESIKFIHFYIPYIDTLEHMYGYDNAEVKEAAEYILKRTSELNNGKNTNTIITADHGHKKIGKIIDFSRDKKLMKKLELPPYGDTRAPLFRSRYDITKDLDKYPMKVFNRNERELLLGKINKDIEDILPDYLGAAEEDFGFTFNYKVNKKEQGNRNEEPVSNHGGLSTDEMEVPLISI
ncbi:MAG: alkaline phosphatase family protein [Candidatus Parvarchaeum sp.]